MSLLDNNYQDQRLTASQKKKIKPAIQGGGYNYLGKQETVTVPKKWLSDPDHVVAELAYITPKEKKVLIDLNMYGSLDGKPNNAPGGLDSLQGDMGSIGGGNNDGGGNNGGDGGGWSPAAGSPGTPSDYSPPSSTSNDGGYNDRIQRIATGIEPGYRATDDRPFGLDPEQAYMEGKISKDQLEDTLTRTQEVPDQRTLFQKTIDLYQKYSPLGLLSNLFANAPDYVSPPATTGGENEFRTQMNQLAPYAPYAITDTTPQQSVANQYFQNIGMSNQPLSSNLQTDYNNAKTTINSLLGNIPSPSQQFGYGILNNQGFNNQAYADYLRRIGLL